MEEKCPKCDCVSTTRIANMDDGDPRWFCEQCGNKWPRMNGDERVNRDFRATTEAGEKKSCPTCGDVPCVSTVSAPTAVRTYSCCGNTWSENVKFATREELHANHKSLLGTLDIKIEEACARLHQFASISDSVWLGYFAGQSYQAIMANQKYFDLMVSIFNPEKGNLTALSRVVATCAFQDAQIMLDKLKRRAGDE